ncbi:hypothetical protein HMPREF1326_00853 [Akkermansia sp. KLE1605]|nr:hypothetical protein HMPREF1326_00853 [Akkermansia sp. KLE1605]
MGKTDGRPDSHGRGRFNGGWTGSLATAGVLGGTAVPARQTPCPLKAGFRCAAAASRLLHRDRMTKDALFRMVAPV